MKRHRCHPYQNAKEKVGNKYFLVFVLLSYFLYVCNGRRCMVMTQNVIFGDVEYVQGQRKNKNNCSSATNCSLVRMANTCFSAASFSLDSTKWRFSFPALLFFSIAYGAKISTHYIQFSIVTQYDRHLTI